MSNLENTLKSAVVVAKTFGQTGAQLHLTMKKILIAHCIDPYPHWYRSKFTGLLELIKLA